MLASSAVHKPVISHVHCKSFSTLPSHSSLQLRSGWHQEDPEQEGAHHEQGREYHQGVRVSKFTLQYSLYSSIIIMHNTIVQGSIKFPDSWLRLARARRQHQGSEPGPVRQLLGL